MSIRSIHVDTERTWRGGEQQALYLAAGLARRGHPVAVVAQPGSPFAARAREQGLPVHEIAMRGEADVAAARKLSRVLRETAADVVHAHTAHAQSLAALATSRVPGISAFAFTPPTTGATPRPLRVVSRRVDFAIGRWPRRWKYRVGVDRYVAISQAVRDVLIAGGVAPERIDVVPSGIDPARLAVADRAAVRRSLALPPDTPLVGALAHFAWHKGLDVLLAAVPRILAAQPRARFVLAGDGELRAALEAQAARVAPPGTVLFPGFRTDAPSWLAAFDVAVFPSVMEGLNTTILDALALERPVVASRAGGIPEAVLDGETGRLVPPRDPEALAAAIVELLADAARARRLGAAGRRRVLERFTADAMVEGTLAVYRALLDRPGYCGAREPVGNG